MHCSEVDETATGSANFWSAVRVPALLVDALSFDLGADLGRVRGMSSRFTARLNGVSTGRIEARAATEIPRQGGDDARTPH
jgi:hypothetical protein